MSDAHEKNTNPDSAANKLGLEEIVHLANKIGIEYAEAKSELEHLELFKNTVRAQITNRLELDGGMTETKLKRLTDTDPEYIEYLNKLSEARLKSEKLRVRYDSYRNLFEAKRSMLSYQKAEMKIL